MAQVVIEGVNLQYKMVQNIFCIGRNYAAHIQELGNRPEEDPLVFLKPTSALLFEPSEIVLPSFSSDVHYETELVALIGQGGKNIPEHMALDHVVAWGLGLDLTARDLQSKAKARGLPWALAKGFDGAACVSRFVPVKEWPAVSEIEFQMHLNGDLKQHGQTKNMLFSVPFLVSYLSRMFTLQAGDLIFTGTPEGVGPLQQGDEVLLSANGKKHAIFKVAC